MTVPDENANQAPNPFALAAVPERALKDPHVHIAEMIEREIRKWQLSPGMYLEPLVSLAARYGVSQDIATEAVETLISTGLLAGQPRGAVRIVSEPVTWVIDACNQFPTVIEQFAMRMIIAPACAEFAQLNASDPDIEKLHHLSTRMTARLTERETTYVEEREFDLTLAEMARNPFLLTETRQLWRLLESHTWRIIRKRSQGPAEWAETAADYTAISGAVAHGSASSAGSAMRQHLRHLDRRFFYGRAVESGSYFDMRFSSCYGRSRLD